VNTASAVRLLRSAVERGWTNQPGPAFPRSPGIILGISLAFFRPPLMRIWVRYVRNADFHGRVFQGHRNLPNTPEIEVHLTRLIPYLGLKPFHGLAPR